MLSIVILTFVGNLLLAGAGGGSGAPLLSVRPPTVLNAYPTESGLFQDDVRPMVDSIISAHGAEEWNATLLTNELHRHLGTYSIIGAKMGIRAREILGAGMDELSVESHAGGEPPLSCLNDGLQVSTGASLGRGTISIEKNISLPEALFFYANKRLKLRLKLTVTERIAGDIASAVKRFGNLTPAYFAEVRRLSLNHWLDLKRSDIFEESTEILFF